MNKIFNTPIFELVKRFFLLTIVLLSSVSSYAVLNSSALTIVWNSPNYTCSGWAYDSNAPTTMRIWVYVDGHDGDHFYKNGTLIARQDVADYLVTQPSNLYTIDMGNNFGYTFDLLGSDFDFTQAHTIWVDMSPSWVTACTATTTIQTATSILKVSPQTDIQINQTGNKNEFIINAGSQQVLSTTVMNIQGKTVFQSVKASNFVNLSSLPKGVYIFKVHAEKSDVVKKIILM